jgi:hypothetical protein
VERIRITADRMETVSRDIAQYSRSSHSLDLKPLALDTLAEECIRRHFPERRKAFHIRAPQKDAALRGDGPRLEQVFLNLFKNALEAGAGKVEIRFRSWYDRLVMAVEDDGIGCHPEELDRLAQPFYSGKGAAGTGLGCSIAESILTAHGASLRLYSKNALGAGGSGLVLNMVFPIGEPESPGRPSADILVVSEDARTRNNMIVPMMHLGLRPMVLPPDMGMREWEGPLPKSLFLDWAIADSYFRQGSAAPAILVDRDRKAVFAPAAHGKGSDAFLFTEENLAGLMPEGKAR